MNQITDMHCHILPGLDDGSKSMEETMEALREASRQGITSVIATPHYYPGRYEPDAGEVLHAWRQVKQRISLEGLPLALYPGQECFYYSGVLAHFERYKCLRDIQRLYELKNRGIWLQMNFDTLLMRDSIFHRNPWRQLAAEGMADFFGSDCHGMDFRPYRVQKACSWMEEHLSPGILQRTMQSNIQKILKSERQE